MAYLAPPDVAPAALVEVFFFPEVDGVGADADAFEHEAFEFGAEFYFQILLILNEFRTS